MNVKTIAAVIALAAAFQTSQNAYAGVINFDVCLTNCQVLDVENGGSINSIASLTFDNNGSGGVDFILTNTIDDIGADQDRAFLTRLFLDTPILPTGFSNESISVDNILLGLDSFNIEQNLFDVRVDLARTGTGFFDRVLAGDSASFTLDGVSAQDFSANSIVSVQRIRSDDGFGGARIFGSTVVDQQAQSVPEPGVLALLTFGLACIGIRTQRRSKQAA